jgi:hypothetical protein
LRDSAREPVKHLDYIGQPNWEDKSAEMAGYETCKTGGGSVIEVVPPFSREAGKRRGRATLINMRPRQHSWRIIVTLRSKLISLRKYGIKVALIYAHSHKSVLP